MLNVITNTETTARDGGEFAITTYTVGGYALVRTELPDLDRVHWSVRAYRGLPTIVDMSPFMAEAPEFGVNWHAQGEQSSSNTRAYVALLATAADVADVFNHIVAGN